MRICLQRTKWPAVALCAASVFFAVAAPPVVRGGERPDDFAETKAVLTEIYHDEVHAYSSYKLYADKAEEEGYSRIAALFRAIAVSEMIHARNMKQLLKDLGDEVAEEEFTVTVETTKKNLKRAMDVELSEISDTYPAYLQRLEPENYQPAIEAVRYSWNSEKQHRDHITRIRRYVGFFFGAVVDEIESGPEVYHVCTFCGSTVDALPENSCSICREAASLSVKVPGDDYPRSE